MLGQQRLEELKLCIYMLKKHAKLTKDIPPLALQWNTGYLISLLENNLPAEPQMGLNIVGSLDKIWSKSVVK